MQRSTAHLKPQTEPLAPPDQRKGRFVQMTGRRRREVLKGVELGLRLKKAAARANRTATAPEGTDVSDMSSEEFIAFRRR